MQNLTNKISRKHLLLFFISTLFVGICSNRILMSTSMMAIFFTVLIGGIYNGDFKQNIKKLCKGGVFFSVMLSILVSIIGCAYTTNLAYGWKLLVLGSPFLFIPLSIGAAPTILKKDLNFLVYVFCVVLFITGITITSNYVFHYDEMNEALGRGKAIETPFREHIRYSLMMSFCCVALIYLLLNKMFLYKERLERTIQLIVLGLFVVILHILSVRSGLLSLYMCFTLYAFYFSFYKKKHLLSILMILSVLVLPMIAFKTVPSVQKKVSYMIYDMQMLSVGKGSNYSDSERLISMAAGAKLIRENLIFGVGTGDIKDAMNTIYDRDYPYIDINNRKLPHNQFIWMWASNGILGITAFLVSIFYPLLYKKNYKNLLLLMFSIITMSSFVTEHTLEIQVGVAFYVIWMTIILNYLNGLNEDEYRV